MNLNEECLASSETISEAGVGAGGEEEEGASATNSELDEIPRSIGPHETKRFKFKHEILYDVWDPKERKYLELPLSGSGPGNERAQIHIWTQSEDVSAERSSPAQISFGSSAHLPDSIRLIVRRGDEVENLNPVLSVFLLPAGATRGSDQLFVRFPVRF